MKRRIDWRGILARLPLPMLALSASWGVYSFARLYVPLPIAVIQAAAFELTYIGLAVTRGLSPSQRRRATLISVGAVVVSVLYNAIDGLFTRNPAWLVGLPPTAEIGGAILHGAPLAIVAYLVADLLLHSQPHTDRPRQLRALVKRLARTLRTARAQLAPLEAMLAQARAELEVAREKLRSEGESFAQALLDAAPLRERLAQEDGEIARLREQLARTEAEAGQARESLARAQSEIEPMRERLARSEPAAASLGRRAEELGDQLRTAREEARRFAHEAAQLRERPAPMPPSRQQVIAYARDLLASGRSLLSIAEELDYPESTLRTWLKGATNGHAIEQA